MDINMSVLCSGTKSGLGESENFEEKNDNDVFTCGKLPKQKCFKIVFEAKFFDYL